MLQVLRIDIGREMIITRSAIELEVMPRAIDERAPQNRAF
jgi:hypothetical protein